MTPHPDKLLIDLGCAVDSDGFPVTDRSGRTSAVGVWAAGNATDPRAQVITAAGAGSAAAIAINANLLENDIAIAARTAHEPSATVELGANSIDHARVVARLARPSTSAALRPAALPPATTTS